METKTKENPLGGTTEPLSITELLQRLVQSAHVCGFSSAETYCFGELIKIEITVLNKEENK